MKIILKTIILLLVCSCSQSQSIEKETVKSFLENRKGVKYDIKLEYQEFKLVTITVGDSIQILEEKYKQEQSKKLSSINSKIASLEKRIGKKKELSSAVDKAVESSLQKRYNHDLKKTQIKKQEIESWRPKYLNKYAASTDLKKPLVKRADAIFKAQEPNKTVIAEYTRSFILSLDGTKCFKMIAHPSLEK